MFFYFALQNSPNRRMILEDKILKKTWESLLLAYPRPPALALPNPKDKQRS